MLANLNPIGVIFSGIFLASIYVGADAMSRAMNVPLFGRCHSCINCTVHTIKSCIRSLQNIVFRS